MMNYLYITFGITGQQIWPKAGHIVKPKLSDSPFSKRVV
jgi:hypothetical protein